MHGRRNDGFHDLTSVVVALAFGDTLEICLNEGEDSLHCSDELLQLGPENLILRAAAAFRRVTGFDQSFGFRLEKHIPVGAGLGGGSSNASVALKGMNALCGEPLSSDELGKLSAEIGSDCPFFIEQKPALMTGRGERIDVLPAELIELLAGQQLLLFKPDFAVETKWAYSQLIDAAPLYYEAESAAQARLRAFGSEQLGSELLFNSFQAAIGQKFIAISALLGDLRDAGVPCLMSGSGSCCFALLRDSKLDPAEIERRVRSAWGGSVFFIETSILAKETDSVGGGIQ